MTPVQDPGWPANVYSQELIQIPLWQNPNPAPQQVWFMLGLRSQTLRITSIQIVLPFKEYIAINQYKFELNYISMIQFYSTTIKQNGHIVMQKALNAKQVVISIQQLLSRNIQKQQKADITIHLNSLIHNVSTAKKVKQGNNQIGYIEQSQLDLQQHFNDIQMLQEQVLLFDKDEQIRDYIQTEKMLAQNVQQTLTALCLNLIRLTKNNLKYSSAYLDIKMIEPKDYQRSIYTKEQLDQIQEKCMHTFTKVKQERKKLETCVICWAQQAKVILMPCMHLIVCIQCSKAYQNRNQRYPQIKQGKKQCPLCKKNVEKVGTVFK